MIGHVGIGWNERLVIIGQEIGQRYFSFVPVWCYENQGWVDIGWLRIIVVGVGLKWVVVFKVLSVWIHSTKIPIFEMGAQPMGCDFVFSRPHLRPV